MPSLPSFVFEEVESSGSLLFEEFFAIYEAAFPIEDEREGVEAFDAILGLNRDRRVQDAFGPYREVVAAVRSWDGGPVIGGHVFGIVSGPLHRRLGYAASIQGIYSFLHPDHRGSVPIAAFSAYCRSMATRIFGHGMTSPRVAPILMEVNNPLRMRPDEIVMDREVSGLDPSRRYGFWHRSGYSPLDVCYVQPRLRDDAEPIRYLDLFCSRDSGPSLSADLLIAHLRAFLSVSVLKGDDADHDVDFMSLRASLPPGSSVSIVDPASPDQRTIRSLARRARQEEGHDVAG